jgi:hypothetical protein
MAVRIAALSASIVLAGSAAASAQSRPGMPTAPIEPYAAYEMIASGMDARAEATLLRQARLHPRAPEVMLNLAALRLRSGREEDAAGLYEQVLSLPEMDMDMPDGSIRSSHAVARVGIARIHA